MIPSNIYDPYDLKQQEKNWCFGGWAEGGGSQTFLSYILGGSSMFFQWDWGGSSKFLPTT